MVACGRGPDKLETSGPRIDASRTAQSSDLSEAVIQANLDPHISLNSDGSVSIPNLYQPEWKGTTLKGNQKLSLIAVE